MSRTRADELEAVISGRRSLDLASPEVRRLASVGLEVGATSRLETPDPTWQAALRHRLLTEAIPALVDDRARPVSLRERLATSARTAIATGAAGALVGSTGVVAAAAHSVPGDLLYPVKQATEQVRLLLSPSAASDARLHLQFAGERLDELEEIAGVASRADVGAVLLDLDGHVASAIATARATGDGALWEAIALHLADQSQRLEEVAARLPASQRSLLLRSNATVVALLSAAIADLPPDVAPPAATEPPADPTDGATPPPGSTPTEEPSGLPEPPVEEPDDLVPDLPGPLDDVGTDLEDLLRDLLDGLGVLSPDPLATPPAVPDLDVASEIDLDGLLGN
ncbi:MAG: DUF5667 domain-containing protein [Nitriliruptorales bacterium]|nr:DUF5667 domain-containing protein [Nitriliruptorales bacterium]